MNHMIMKDGSIVLIMDDKTQIEFEDFESMGEWVELLTDEYNSISDEVEQHDAKLEHDPRD